MNMGKHRKKVPKRLSPKVWVNNGFGNGYYMFRRITMTPDCRLVRMCESKDSTELWEHPVKLPSLDSMGLKRLESGRVVPK